MGEIEFVEPHSDYRCECPLPQDSEEEIRLARECSERQQAFEAAASQAGQGGGREEG